MGWGLDTTVWAVLAIVLVAGEALLPGAALLWLGVAAGAVCVLVLLLPDTPFVVQALAFAVLSFLAIRYLRLRGGPAAASDQPALNRRAEQLVGRVVPLLDAIQDGHGRVQIADAFWDVEGPDLPAGTRVRIVGARGMTLLVREQA
ncbi:NfeD family protein [Lysobacter sp. N42]|nr:NfeD family protein [Lysobacter sp. N42]TCZ86053.1 NfeD family protein [Lysobacter sp. N42]